MGCPQNGTAVLSAAEPNVIAVGSPATTVHLTGKNFTQTASAVWTSPVGVQTQLATTFVNSTALNAVVPSNLLVSAGSAKIFAFQSGQNQSQTQSLTIVIGNVAPTLTAVAPAHAIVGAADLTVTLTGTNFNGSSTAMFGATSLTTTLVSSTSITAVIPAAQLASAGLDKLTVQNAGTGGGTSSAVNFTVVSLLKITTASLPGGSLGTAYSATLAATGGTPPYSWTIFSGSLPTGLTLNGATGVISGTPTAAGSATFTIQVVDTTGALARKLLK